MAFNPASAILRLWLWSIEQIIAYLEPVRVTYDETKFQLIYVRWAEVTGYMIGFVLLPFVGAVASGSWGFALFVVIVGFGLVGVITLALRHIRSTVTANKPEAWIRVVHTGVFGGKSHVFNLKALKTITCEPVRMRSGLSDVTIMTSEGSVVILHEEGSEFASELVAYLNGFFFDDDGDDIVWEEGHGPSDPTTTTGSH
jgi:hypothetical protein